MRRFLLPFVILCACTGETQQVPADAAPVDGATFPGDGAVETDADTVDAEIPLPRDAGPRWDAGTGNDGGPSPDAGSQPSDAGVPADDAGTPPVDAGTPLRDAGSPARDAGAPPTDAGVPHIDAGVDAGPVGTTAGCGLSGARTGTWQQEITVGGQRRSFHISVPAGYRSAVSQRLYFAVHGTGWTGAMIRPYYDIESVPGGDGQELYVYPDRHPSRSNLETTGAAATEDLAYFDAMLQWVHDRYCVDEERTFAMGHSGGGNWVTFLSCHRGSVLRAVAPTGTGGAWWYAGLSRNNVSACDGPVAAMVIHGRRDSIIPYTPWGAEAIDYFRVLNGCSAGLGTTIPGTSCRLMNGCTDSYDCSHDEATFLGDGHQIPSWHRVEVMRWLRSF